MTRGQRLSAAIALAAAVLLVGRAVAVLLVEREWYAELGAESVWHSNLTSAALMYGLAFAIGFVFAWINVSAVRRSVIALVVPKRVGNVEIGEEVPSIRLRWVTAAMSALVALVSLVALPSWTTLALWRSNVVFAETDPYFQLDLSHFVSWLPLETAVYQWGVTLFALTTALVVALYALTPSLSWGKRGLRVASYTRRHLSVLGGLLLLFAAWGFRLDAFRTVIEGSGPDGAFTRMDHLWIIPADVALSLITIGAAVVLVASGWMGQTTTSFVTVSVIIAGTVLTQAVGPWISGRLAVAPRTTAQEEPYRETRDAYTARAFPFEPPSPALRTAADSSVLANAGRMQIRGGLPDIIYPGAMGAAVVLDPRHQIDAPRLGSGFTRFLHAWSEQNPRMLDGSIPAEAAFVRERDVRARVRALAPIFAQSGPLGAVMTANGILWVVDLYATSDMYPLSTPKHLQNMRLTYRHHVGTAYVSGGTAATVIVPDAVLDPISRAWFGAHPGAYLTPTLPPPMVAPPQTPPATTAAPTGAAAEAFHRDVTRIYERMRSALDSGDLRSFGAAFDSLGVVIRGGKPK